MIAKIVGKLAEKKEHSVVIDVQGLFYEIVVPGSVLQRIEESKDTNGNVELIIYHYLQMSPSSAIPTLIGFMSEVEKDFFQHFIKVSGIGPRAAVKALNKPISEITRAIDQGDVSYLKTLPGIGMQRAKEIVAKLQGKIGRFGLIQDKIQERPLINGSALEDEALAILMQLQYKRQEALDMIRKTLEKSKDIQTSEDLLNEIYNQKVKS